MKVQHNVDMKKNRQTRSSNRGGGRTRESDAKKFLPN